MDHARNLRDRCFDLIEAGRLTEAEELAGLGLERFPDDGRLHQLRGLVRQRLGDWKGACSDLETAGLLVPLDAATRCALAESYARTDRSAPARDLYLHLADDPSCPDGLLPAVAAGLGSLGAYEAAWGVCLEQIRRDPNRHEAHFGAAFYRRRLGHSVEAALPSIRRAHELAPQVSLYRMTLASLLTLLGRNDDAYDLLRDLGPDEVRCPCCVRRIMNVFRLAGDHERSEAFRAQDDSISDRSDV